MNALHAFARRARGAPIVLASLALFTLMVMTFTDVILRSVYDAPLEAAAELTRILMAVMVFSCLPQISATGGHITVDLADGLFDRLRLNRLRTATINMACGVMLFWPAERVWVLAERARGYGDVTEYLAIPVFYVTAFIAASVAITAVVMIVAGLIGLFEPPQQDEDIAA